MRDKFLLDTNIIIYYFDGIVEDDKIDNILKESFNISIITKIEFLSWQRFREDEVLKEKALNFISNANVYELTDMIADKVIEIRQQYKIKTHDAINQALNYVYAFLYHRLQSALLKMGVNIYHSFLHTSKAYEIIV